jgi:mRNA-degrading endonuclease RelE of RelBE toxin-antitoxin system
LRLRGSLDNFWKDRVGTYRIIYKIDSGARRIIFYDVDLRKRVYD